MQTVFSARWLGAAFGALVLGAASDGVASPQFALRTAGSDSALVCHREISAVERMAGIPVQLLESIALTESGRFHKGANRRVAWPWTINVEGKGYYFDTKEEAVAAVRRHQAQGIRSIDVGCMQINLRHHPNAFPNIETALDPATNVRYAARFILDLRNQTGTWSGAVGNYHSATPNLHNAYKMRVLNTWRETRRDFAVDNRSNFAFQQNALLQQRLALLEQRRQSRIRIASYR